MKRRKGSGEKVDTQVDTQVDSGACHGDNNRVRLDRKSTLFLSGANFLALRVSVDSCN